MHDALNAELFKDGASVRVDGFCGHVHAMGDLFVTETFEHIERGFLLARAQLFEGPWELGLIGILLDKGFRTWRGGWLVTEGHRIWVDENYLMGNTLKCMADNPLAGISIPSMHDIVEGAVDMMGARIIDLSNPLQRRRLIEALGECLDMGITFELQRALEAATKRAIEHVFMVMRDADYQEKKRRRKEINRTRRSAEREKKETAEREARMDYSRRNLKVSKATVQ